MMSKEIWNVGGITQSRLFLWIKRIDDRIAHSDFDFEIYDSYPGIVWNGGRQTSQSPQHTLDSFVHEVELLNSSGIGFNFTFSNLLLKEEHLADPLGNHLLARFHNGQNGAIVGSPVLAKYIRQTFPRYRLINTLTHYHRDLDYYMGALDLYDILVLPPSLNDRRDYIQELGPDRVEILVNETCHRNCPFSKDHYTKISQYNLSLGQDPDLESELEQYCPRHHRERFQAMSAVELGKNLVGTALAPAEVAKFTELGVSRFKLSARNRIGEMHVDIFADIKAFVFRRIESSEVKDPSHLFTNILALNPTAFEALR
jgi:hypothetical protein